MANKLKTYCEQPNREICSPGIAMFTKLHIAIQDNVLQLYRTSYAVRSAFLATAGFLVINDEMCRLFYM